MNCWKCNKQYSEKDVKVGYRAVCPHCDTDLHTCTNCRYYSPGKPNDCSIPGTDYVRNREANNFCEDFKPKLSSDSRPDKKEEKRKFNSLFKDDEE